MANQAFVISRLTTRLGWLPVPGGRNVPSFKGQEVQFTFVQVFPDAGELQTSGFRLKPQRRSEASNFDSYRGYAMFALTRLRNHEIALWESQENPDRGSLAFCGVNN